MIDNILPPGPIGPQIRWLRKERDLSLEDLARRAGTSAPTLHRYESGWDRFEIGTLRKIARALEARLEVRLRPRRPRSAEPTTTRDLVRHLAPLFWDHKLVSSDLVDHRAWVLGRVLMFGDSAQVEAARRYFGDEAIEEAIRGRGIDPRTRNYWERMLAS